MKQFMVFVRKEFYHVFRDRRTLLILFGLPVMQILLFGYALTTEIKNAKIIVIDNAKDVNSEQLIAKIRASTYFSIVEGDDMGAAFRKGEIRCAVVFPPGFGNDLLHGNTAQIQIVADASDPNTAKTLTNYLTAIINDYQQSIQPMVTIPYQIQPVLRMLYNPALNGSMNFVPGVIALVLMIICTTLTSVSIVREKENGTMEILLVSPFNPTYVVLAKAVPYLVLSLLDFIIILLLSVFLLDMPVRGSLVLLFMESTLFIISCLSLGLLISSVARSQQIAMLMSMMGMMLPTILFTGFIFPLENMPLPLQLISNLIPSRWFYFIVKAVMLKGLGFGAVWKQTLILAGMTIVLLTISIKTFKTRLS
ncbi:ABC-2 type transport system permease protein [Chitinophaga sp. CF118]|uniref:ABC transporter permease n=1 Tax=Chitinophaga sp. CF118 TaxID=1884367 RepID=UPI0008F1B830|nr:ABC transporter permease [Chitinophaga sp. CF118]SFF03317.1 ABC-2 type transport system permease protein [Chitinophaga sp. CF118]